MCPVQVSVSHNQNSHILAADDGIVLFLSPPQVNSLFFLSSYMIELHSAQSRLCPVYKAVFHIRFSYSEGLWI